jgi:general secretion pathway protein D
MHYKYIPVVLFILFSTGCTLVSSGDRPDTKKNLIPNIKDYLSQEEESFESTAPLIEEKSVEELSFSIDSTDDVISLNFPNMHKSTVFNDDSFSNKKYFDDEKVKLSIESMPVNQFINLVFSKILDVNFVLDKSIEKNRQPVSLSIKKKIKKTKLFDIVLNVLRQFNISVNVEKDIFYLKSSKKSFTSAQGVYIGKDIPSNVSDNSIIYFMKPFYYNKNLLRYNSLVKSYFLTKGANLEIDFGEKFIKIKDKAINIRKAIKFYDFIDKASMHDKTIKLVKMKHMDVKKFIKEIEPILKSYGILMASNASQPGVQLVPIAQINSFLLISSKQSWSDMVLLWREKLDIPEKKSIDKTGFFVYKPLNRKAKELNDILSKMLRNRREFTSSKKTSYDSNSSHENQKIETEFNMVVDEERNNIILKTTQEKYFLIHKLLKKLDTLPKQVLVEVTIAEITLTDSLEFGLEWFLKNNANKYGYSLSALGSGSAGVVGNLFSISGSFGTIFNMLAKKKYLNILSNPKLLVLNNHSANINIGNQVPIITSQASASDLGSNSGSPSVLQNISYRNTGITLNVTPTINSEGYLTLNISQTVSDAQTNNTSDISSPLIFTRSLNTDVILKSGESVMLGGLITENKSKDESKIPLLGDIPYVKNLFSTNSDSVFRTELVILVKPTILSTSEDTKVVTDAILELLNFQ